MNYSMEEYKKIDEVITEIEDEAINKLRFELKEIEANYVDVNDFSRFLKKIRYKKNENQQLNFIKAFLIDNYRFYKKEDESPLNNFFFNCGKILQKHF